MPRSNERKNEYIKFKIYEDRIAYSESILTRLHSKKLILYGPYHFIKIHGTFLTNPKKITLWVESGRSLKSERFTHKLINGYWKYQLHRCWRRMLETKLVGDNFKMLVIVSTILATNFRFLLICGHQYSKDVTKTEILSSTSENCHQF